MGWVRAEAGNTRATHKPPRSSHQPSMAAESSLARRWTRWHPCSVGAAGSVEAARAAAVAAVPVIMARRFIAGIPSAAARTVVFGIIFSLWVDFSPRQRYL